jgi:nitroreductase
MDTLQAIFTRRSIRRYTDQPISEQQVEQILRAAMAAPSAGNQQPWQFVVVNDRKLLDAISGYHPYADMLRQAPVAIIVCGDMHLAERAGYWVQDCSAATQNLLLAAHALGLGAVWLGVYPMQDRVGNTQRLFGLPPEVIPLAIVALGHPAERLKPADRYNPERVHRNRW